MTAINKIKDAVEGLSQIDESFKKMYKNSEGFFLNLSTMSDGLAKIGAAIPGIDTLSKTLLEMTNVLAKAGIVFDRFGEAQRRMTKDSLDLSASLGGGIEKALEFNQRMTDIAKTNSDLSDTGFFINQEETEAVFKNIGYYLKDSNGEILKYSGSINNVSVSAEHMIAILKDISGLDTRYYSTLNDLISKNGLTFQQAIETIASYKDIASSTGLSVESVSSALSSSVSGFAKLGVTVDFAKPALEGFAQSMKKIGLGIGEATDLSQALSRSLLNVANDYGKAYVMFQQGNLDFGGGGGVLGSSIGYRAKMLDATPEEQEKIGFDMIKAMKDTLTSFTGNSGIVGVKDAAQSPELQTKYFAQEQMLSSMFGISDQGQRDRTLELLKDLDEATRSGDTDRADALSKQIVEAQKSREETKSMSEKLGAILQGSFVEQVKQSSLLQKQLEISIFSNAAKILPGYDEMEDKPQSIYDYLSQTRSSITDFVKEANGSVTDLLKGLDQGEGQDSLANIQTFFDNLASNNFDVQNNGSDSQGSENRSYNFTFNMNAQGDKDALVAINPETQKYMIVHKDDPAYNHLKAGLANRTSK